jgi:putative nucleotidyltransferase-like protein
MELGNRPSPGQELILKAALDPPEQGRLAWESWRASVDFDQIDHGSMRLLPLVYRNLGAESFDPEVARRMKGIYRRSWTHNQMLFRRAAGAIARLNGAGIETMVLKGASLSLLAYGSAGVRPMDDVDVLVPIERRVDAVEVMRAAGWRSEKADAEAWARVHHSMGIHGPEGGNMDLHWFSLWQPARDEPLWQGAVPLELSGTQTLAPCPADQLLLVCVHGTPWSPLPPFRWIADAAAVIRSSGDNLDWDRLLAEAERRQLTVASAAALGYLREEFGLAVPAIVLDRLRAAPASRHERAAFRAACQPDGPLRTLRMAWDRYRRLRDLDTGAPRPAGFVSFARRFWGLDSVWQLPLHAGRALSRRRLRDAGRSAL